MKKRWLFVFLPLSFSLVGSFLWNKTSWANPLVQIRASLSVYLFLFGALLTVGLIIYLWNQEISQKNYKSLAKKHEEARRRFFARLDHELKNPLTALESASANAASDPTGEAFHEAQESMNRQIERLNLLITGLRSIALIETQPLEMVEVDLKTLLSEAVEWANDQSQLKAEGREVTLTLPIAPRPLPTILGDDDLLYLAISNLLKNAIKFTEAEDAIEVKARENDRTIEIEVADTGPGIPEDERPYVFDELYRGRHGRSKPGSGLGLAIVKAVVDRHGGQVEIVRNIDVGTVARVKLPTERSEIQV